MTSVKLAIDFGSANMKILGYHNGIERKTTIRSLASNLSIDDNYTVIYNNNKIHFGVGSPLVKVNKIERDYIIESILLATNEIYGDIDDYFDISLAIGLPLEQYKSSSKDDYDSLLKNKLLDNKIKGIINGKEITIKISFINIYAEGYSGFVSLFNVFNKIEPFLVIDVGYKTTDVIGLTPRGISNKLIIDKYCSINTGMLEIFNSIKNKVYDDTKYNCPSSTLEDAIISNRLLRIPTQNGSNKINPKEWLKYGSYIVNDIFNTLETDYFPDIKTRNLYFIGGGASLLYSIFNQSGNLNKYKSLNLEFLTNNEQALYANVLGYYIQLDRDLKLMNTLVPQDKILFNKKVI